MISSTFGVLPFITWPGDEYAFVTSHATYEWHFVSSNVFMSPVSTYGALVLCVMYEARSGFGNPVPLLSRRIGRCPPSFTFAVAPFWIVWSVGMNSPGW